jgi:hypothetical protein
MADVFCDFNLGVVDVGRPQKTSCVVRVLGGEVPDVSVRDRLDR